MLAVAGGADTDVGAPMIDLIDNRTLLIVGCTALVLTGLIGVLSAIFLAWREDARRRQLVAVSEVTRDWQPTWKINAVTDACVMENEKDDIPSNFVLRIEENRMVRDIGGGEVMEIAGGRRPRPRCARSCAATTMSRTRPRRRRSM